MKKVIKKLLQLQILQKNVLKLERHVTKNVRTKRQEHVAKERNLNLHVQILKQNVQNLNKGLSTLIKVTATEIKNLNVVNLKKRKNVQVLKIQKDHLHQNQLRRLKYN